MALILLCSKRLATFWDTEKDQAMLHQNSVFHSLLKHVPWHKLDRSVERHGADKLSRKLDTKRHVIALLYGQFSGASSLREIVTGMASHETRLYHAGSAVVKRSTLSDANAQRRWQVFGELFTAMLPQAQHPPFPDSLARLVVELRLAERAGKECESLRRRARARLAQNHIRAP